ncbi:MAG: thiamine pyrophosphate-dependent dehydrogenase E1 component subunit alpha [Chloroflexi bacterium]|nr:thiamine pyrophosphate-dependent dehydrogenase E1 component subunit alpha [Chloroflexota bacterium]
MEITPDTLRWLYRAMLTIRMFEERVIAEVVRGKTFGSVHTSDGQEAVPAGVCAHLRREDYIASTHRGHGHCISKGVEPRVMMAEIFGRATGSCKGKGGSMHIADFSRGMLGANGVVGASVPTACGAALTAKLRGEDRVSVAFFGDGASNQGVVHESMNLASIWKLPVIFVCENNLYAESTPVEYSTSVASIAERARGYSMPGRMVDGMDVLAVYDAAGWAVGRARAGQGPTLLECRTYRYHGHFYGDNPSLYRLKEEEEEYHRRDAIASFKRRALEQGMLPECDVVAIEREVAATIEEAVAFADASPMPSAEELLADVYVSYP